MSRADYAKIADVLRGFVRDCDVVEPEEVCAALASLFKDENHYFHAVTFFKACGIEHDAAVALASDL